MPTTAARHDRDAPQTRERRRGAASGYPQGIRDGREFAHADAVDEDIALMRSDELAAQGFGPARRRDLLQDDIIMRVRSGVFTFTEQWDAAWPEQRILMRARALALTSKRPPVFSHETAAAMHGLPLYSPDATRVHVIAPSERPGAARDVVRHRGDLRDDEIVEIGELRCTSLVRTVADVARTASFEAAVTVTDAALRLTVTEDPLAEAEARTLIRETFRRSAHGQSRAERVLRFADPRAQRPGESVSRIRLVELGFAVPDLQVAIPGPHSDSTYYVDFGLDDVNALGEFDGRIKYVDGRFTLGRNPAEVLEKEKQREDWIRGIRQCPFVRWGWPHIGSAPKLGSRLASFGVHPPR